MSTPDNIPPIRPDLPPVPANVPPTDPDGREFPDNPKPDDVEVPGTRDTGGDNPSPINPVFP